MKRETVVALGLLLLIPAVLMLGGFLFAMINPEIAAGHANYARNFYLLSRLRVAVFFGSGAVAAVLWVLAALGPVGLAVLASLNDRVPAETDRHARFVAHLNGFQRAGYEVCRFVLI